MAPAGESLFGNSIEAVELCTMPGESYRIPWSEEIKKALAPWFENAERTKVFFDAKRAMHLLAAEGVGLTGILFDASLASYLVQTGGEKTLEGLCEQLQVDEEAPGSRVFVCWQKLAALLEDVSKEQGGEKTVATIFRDIELPLIPVLFGMERRGILLNKKTFSDMSDAMAETLDAIAQELYSIAGREFNINSTKQLAVILFEDLHLPTEGIKRTKSGYSTASSELQKLSEYPVAKKIEEYRELFKLKSTYLDALPLLTDKESRLHTTYSQTVAATGRLSSLDPNLQNIPIRGKWGEVVRSAFEASPGYVLVGADYSQMELRIMTHLSGDKALAEAFRKGEDVHQTTASVVFKVEPEAVTSDMRRKAKVFNFGLMYGMGAFGLSQAAGINQKEAKEFIDLYFGKFKGVKRYIDRIIRETKQQGYQETELGRRRLIPEIQSSNIQVERAGERIAVNMPIQGLEADIVKLAMLASDQLAKEYKEGEVYQLLQVHDEIIFEIKTDLAPVFAQKLKRVMEEVYPLSVPIVVEASIGKNWGEI